MTHQRFAWLEPATQLDHELTLAVGPGYCSKQEDAKAYATVDELRRGTKPGHLISSAALVYLRQGQERRWVLLQRDAAADVDASKWQFPAGRATPDELPLTTACRKLADEVSLIEAGALRSWKDARIRVGGGVISYLREDKVDYFKGRYVYAHNTVEFYYPMELEVADLDSVTIADNEEHGRVAGSFSFDEVEAMVRQGLLTDVSAALWASAKAEGVLILS